MTDLVKRLEKWAKDNGAPIWIEAVNRIKELEAVYESGLPVAEFLRGDDGATDVDVTERFVGAVDAVQTGLISHSLRDDD